MTGDGNSEPIICVVSVSQTIYDLISSGRKREYAIINTDVTNCLQNIKASDILIFKSESRQSLEKVVDRVNSLPNPEMPMKVFYFKDN